MKSPDVPAGGRPTGDTTARQRSSRANFPRPSAFSLSNWPVSRRLVAVIVMAVVMGLVFGGLRVAVSVESATGFARTTQLALLGQQVTQLAQAMEDERDTSAGVAAFGEIGPPPPPPLTKADAKHWAPEQKQAADENNELAARQHATDAIARRVQALAAGIGSTFPQNTQAKAQAVSAVIGNLSGLRTEWVGQAPQAAIQDYSGAIAQLFALNDEITSGSGDPTLADHVRTLDAMSRAKDQVSQQRAILYAALIEDTVGQTYGLATALTATTATLIGQQAMIDAGGLQALTTAQGLQQADLFAFTQSATPAQQNAYLNSVNGARVGTANLMNDFVTAAGNPTFTYQAGATQPALSTSANPTLGITQQNAPDVWYDNTSGTISLMRSIENQVAQAIVARSEALKQGAQRSALLTGAVTGGVLLLVLIATIIVARSLVDPLRRLQTDALEIATVRLPARVAELSESTNPGASLHVEPISVHSTDEIGKVARAFDQVHREAVRLAGNEALLRGNLNTMFISLSRRSVPLIDRLARMIDSLEQNEDDPDQLSNLFSMDHLVTRMRRNSENLLVLAGEEPVRKWSEPVPLADVARAATSEIEQYSRVVLNVQSGIAVSGQAVADIVHLLAEIVENATMFSPRDTPVQVSGQELTSGGALIEVRDSGVGVSEARLAEMNWRLDNPPLIDVTVSRHMGLFAVSRLAARHGVRVRLRPASPQGLSALIWLPGNLTGRETVQVGGDRSARQLAGRSAAAAAAAEEQTVAGRRIPGRHRVGLLSVGDGYQAGDGYTDSAGGQRGGTRTAAAEYTAQPTSNWFRPKRPSSPGARGAGDGTGNGSASGAQTWSAFGGNNWRAPGADAAPSTGNSAPSGDSWASSGSPWASAGTWGPAGWQAGEPAASPVHGDRTPAGLPVRVPQANIFPGTAADLPTRDSGATGGMPAYRQAPMDHPAERTTGPQPAALPRRSADQARSRLSGFQLGSREAEGRTPRAGEEASR
jgi:signal transduction histidine kinase